MNTKKLFMLLAAMLLGSLGTFAQYSYIGLTVPIKGDVSGDGIVDVADITAIIKIIKDKEGVEPLPYYLGLTNASKTTWTESDFNSYSTIPIVNFTAPGLTDSNSCDIIVYPESWGEITESLMYVDGENRNPWITPVPWIDSLPSGYKAAFTQFSRSSYITDIRWAKKNNYFIGIANMYKTTWTESDFNSYSATAVTEMLTPRATGDNVILFIYPESWGEITSVNGGSSPWVKDTSWFTLPDGYTAVFTQFSGDHYFKSIHWSK